MKIGPIANEGVDENQTGAFFPTIKVLPWMNQVLVAKNVCLMGDEILKMEISLTSR